MLLVFLAEIFHHEKRKSSYAPASRLKTATRVMNQPGIRERRLRLSSWELELLE
jgi:hypothetical protein